jgi:hypothetical protein
MRASQASAASTSASAPGRMIGRAGVWRLRLVIGKRSARPLPASARLRLALRW